MMANDNTASVKLHKQQTEKQIRMESHIGSV